MTEFLQQLINGLSLGSIYALIALGYTMVYGVLKFINFAHGDVYMVGAFAGLYLAPWVWKVIPQGSDPSRFSWSTAGGALAVLLLSMAVCAMLGVVIERLVYRPLRERPRLTVLITAIGVSIFLENFGQYLFGADPQLFPEILPDRVIDGLGDLTVSVNQVVVFVVTLALLAALSFIVLKTKIGTAMRALSYNPVAASLMGINNDVVIAFTFGLGSALAAAAALLNAINYPAYSIDPLMGILPGIKAFVAAVLGGIGNLPGAVVGGLILGVLETLVVGYVSPMYRDAIAFAVLIAILLFKPNGLLGRAEKEKV
ncbi:MAG: branched-chain amino acid ABC transporter permease [Verrucomicrobiota bacterium]